MHGKIRSPSRLLDRFKVVLSVRYGELTDDELLFQLQGTDYRPETTGKWSNAVL